MIPSSSETGKVCSTLELLTVADLMHVDGGYCSVMAVELPVLRPKLGSRDLEDSWGHVFCRFLIGTTQMETIRAPPTNAGRLWPLPHTLTYDSLFLDSSRGEMKKCSMWKPEFSEHCTPLEQELAAQN